MMKITGTTIRPKIMEIYERATTQQPSSHDLQQNRKAYVHNIRTQYKTIRNGIDNTNKGNDITQKGNLILQSEIALCSLPCLGEMERGGVKVSTFLKTSDIPISAKDMIQILCFPE